MPRKLGNWLEAFCDYASYGEAPRSMYYWVGVSALAGALRRRVWIDQTYFQWYPNFYVILVAPPGIVSKSTTADIGMSLLRRVPGVVFGPAVVTWQALVTSFAQGAEMFDFNGEMHTMSPLTISSSEFGNLLNPHDKDMVDMLVNLWDGKPFKKVTKMSGNDEVVNPWINIIACTTPDWIAGSFPEYMIGGGLTSRCIFVYAEEKAQYVAYPGLTVPHDFDLISDTLVHDLEYISQTLCGPYTLTSAAVDWGEAWYKRHYQEDAEKMDRLRFGGYIARKQTHMHKLAMVIAASERDELFIRPEDLQRAEVALTELEPSMAKVFERIGMRQENVHVQRLLQRIKQQGYLEYTEVYGFLQPHFPYKRELDDVVQNCIAAGHFRLANEGGRFVFRA